MTPLAFPSCQRFASPPTDAFTTYRHHELRTGPTDALRNQGRRDALHPETSHDSSSQSFHRPTRKTRKHGQSPALIAVGKSAAWKIAVAKWMKNSSNVTNGWLADRLGMGTGVYVSKHVGLLKAGSHPKVQPWINRLKKVKGKT